MESYFELFDLLESTHPPSVEEAKKKLHNFFISVKDSWLVNGMFDYYMTTNSVRIVEIFICVREPHDIFLFEKLSESLKTSQKSQALSLLGHIVSRNPTWMYKIVKHQLMKDLFRILKNETEIIPLMSALLTLIILLPIVAGYLGQHLQDVFDVFSRLAAWNTNNPNRIPDGQLLHLQVGLYQLFNRLYGMYPWSFLKHLRHLYSIEDNFPIFNHTIMPMLDMVKMHPLLVTTKSKEKEVTHPRWKKMEVNDVILECAKLTVDYSDKPSARDDCGSFRARTASLRSTSSLDYSTTVFGGGGDGRSSVGIAGVRSYLPESSDVWSPTVFFSGNTPPGSAPTSIPHTPISQTYVSTSTLPQQEGTSPPEAAVEATPESTPVKDLRQGGRDRAAIGPVCNLNSSIMGGSQPSSPMRKDSSIFRYPSSSPLPADPKNPYAVAKFQKIYQDRTQKEARNVASPQKLIQLENWGEQLQSIADSCEQEDREVEATLSHEMNTSTPSHCGVAENSSGGSGVWVDCNDRGGRCQEGGLHMPDYRAMLQITNRLRFYSQCLPDPYPPNLLHGISIGSSPGEGGKFSELQFRRAISCPEMKKPTGTSISADFSCSALDETVEEEEIISNLNGHSTQSENCVEEKKFVDTTVQTDEMPPLLGYEHLFFALYPTSEQPSIHSAPPNVTCPPLFSGEISQTKFSPYTALENYIEASSKASSLRPHVEMSDLKTCKEHISLLMLQLQFERHRREVHAERNRRLLGKSRTNSALEEHNNALKDQVGLLQKDIETLRSELERVKQEHKIKTDKAQQSVNHWQDKSCLFEKQSKENSDRVSLLEQDLRDQKTRFDAKSKEFNECKAMMFELENSLRCATMAAKEGRNVKGEMTRLQHGLTASSENEVKLRSVIDKLLLNSKKAEESLMATQTYRNQAQNFEQQLENKTVQLEATKAKLADMENELAKKDSVISKQKDLIQTIKDDFADKVKEFENKCKELRKINGKLEDTNLELHHRVEMLEVSGKKIHNQSSPPLSASLSSSGNLSLSGAEPTPLTNLQLLVDQSEPSSFRGPPSPT